MNASLLFLLNTSKFPHINILFSSVLFLPLPSFLSPPKLGLREPFIYILIAAALKKRLLSASISLLTGRAERAAVVSVVLCVRYCIKKYS